MPMFIMLTCFMCEITGSLCEMAVLRSQLISWEQYQFFFFIIRVFWDVTLLFFFWPSAISEGLFVQVPAFQEDFDFSDHLILKMKALQSRTLGTTYPLTQHHIEKTDLHQHHCENFTLCILCVLQKFMAVKIFWEYHLKRNLQKF